MRVIRWLGGIVLAIALAIAVLLVGARFADGPLGPIAGGPLRSGEPAPLPDSWQFAEAIQEIDLQLLDPARSRTVWILVKDGKAYIPCGFLDVPLWKQWPYEAERDGRAIVRVAGKLYPVQVVRETEPDTIAALGNIVVDKYLNGRRPPESAGSQTWFFRLDPRAG
jgi:hypothetical protein